MNEIFKSLAILYPKGFSGGDASKPNPQNYAEYQTWVKQGYTVHTEAEINQAAQDYDDGLALADQRRAKREAMRASWDALPDWMQGPFLHVFDSVNHLLDNDKIQAAVDAVESVQPTEEITLSPLVKLIYFKHVKQGFIDSINAL